MVKRQTHTLRGISYMDKRSSLAASRAAERLLKILKRDAKNSTITYNRIKSKNTKRSKKAC